MTKKLPKFCRQNVGGFWRKSFRNDPILEPVKYRFLSGRCSGVRRWSHVHLESNDVGQRQPDVSQPGKVLLNINVKY